MTRTNNCPECDNRMLSGYVVYLLIFHGIFAGELCLSFDMSILSAAVFTACVIKYFKMLQHVHPLWRISCLTYHFALTDFTTRTNSLSCRYTS